MRSIRSVAYDRNLTANIPYLLLRIGEELSDVLFTGSNKFVQDFRTVDDLGLGNVQHLSDLTRHQSLSGTRRSVKENTCDRPFSQSNHNTGSIANVGIHTFRMGDTKLFD